MSKTQQALFLHTYTFECRCGRQFEKSFKEASFAQKAKCPSCGRFGNRMRPTVNWLTWSYSGGGRLGPQEQQDLNVPFGKNHGCSTAKEVDAVLDGIQKKYPHFGRPERYTKKEK